MPFSVTFAVTRDYYGLSDGPLSISMSLFCIYLPISIGPFLSELLCRDGILPPFVCLRVVVVHLDLSKRFCSFFFLGLFVSFSVVSFNVLPACLSHPFQIGGLGKAQDLVPFAQLLSSVWLLLVWFNSLPMFHFFCCCSSLFDSYVSNQTTCLHLVTHTKGQPGFQTNSTDSVSSFSHLCS